MKRLSRFAPEEIAGALMLVVVLLLVALRPTAVTDLLVSPYATPDPSGGAAQHVVAPSATTATVDMWPRPTPATPAAAEGWITWGNSPAARVRVLEVVPRAFLVDLQCPDGRATPTPDTTQNARVSVMCVRSPLLTVP